MVNRTTEANAFLFVVVAALRVRQLINGCVPRVAGTHKVVTMAQLEVAAGKVERLIDPVNP